MSFTQGQRQALDEDFMPAWTVDAACRAISLPGWLWGDCFTDEVARLPPNEEYVWPTKTLNAMEVCCTCSVRRECLDWALRGEDLEAIAAREDENGDARKETTDPGAQRRFGVFAVPGRMRERYASDPDRLSVLLAWLERLAVQHRWKPTATKGAEEVA